MRSQVAAVNARSDDSVAGPTPEPVLIADRPEQALVGLQYLRALASLMVVFFHSEIQINGFGADKLALVGRSGVDIFFVLSGFVMWTSTAGRRSRPLPFLKRRIARIVPLYWMLTLLASGAALVIPSALRSTRFDLPHLVASLLFVPWPNPLAVERGLGEFVTPVIVPGWTLNFEMMFYLLFAIALIVPVRQRVAGIAFLIAVLWGGAYLTQAQSPASLFYANSVIFEFLAGIVLAATVRRWPKLPAGAALAALVVGVVVLLIADGADLQWPRFVLLGLPSIVIVAATIALERAGRIKFFRLPNALGDASYSIYLVHVYAIAALRMLIGTSRMPSEPVGGLLFIVAALTVSAVAGLIIHRWFELPSVALARRLLRA